MGLDREISVEPGLFEWLGWYQTGIPKFMSLTELRENGYNINAHYSPVWPISKYNVHETTEQYYERCHLVTQEILRRHEHEGWSSFFKIFIGPFFKIWISDRVLLFIINFHLIDYFSQYFLFLAYSEYGICAGLLC